MKIIVCDYCDKHIDNPTLAHRVNLFGEYYDICDLCIEMLKYKCDPKQYSRAK